MQFSEAKTYLTSTKLNISLADVVAGNNSLFNIQDITDALNLALKRAWDYKPWTFTEKTLMYSFPSTWNGYMDYPNNFEDESISRLTVNTLEFKKKDFTDYERWFGLYPTDTSKIFSEHERFVFINGNAITVGQEIDISGKLRAPTLVNDTDLLPFSPTTDNSENSGNSAICDLAYSILLNSEKKKNPSGAKAVATDAYAQLDIVWKPMGERKAEKNSQNREFFTGHNLFNDRRSTRSDTNIGNFP